MLLVIAGVAIVAAIALLLTYNRFVRLRNLIDESWHDIDTELQRRYDLIPNLVETVKGYAAHEREVFESVTTLRTQAMAERRPPDAQAPIEQALGHGVAQVMAVAESYPDLKASDALPRAAARAGRHRGSHPGRAPHLQRQRAVVQHDGAELPVDGHRELVPLRDAAVLRGRPRGARSRSAVGRSLRPDLGGSAHGPGRTSRYSTSVKTNAATRMTVDRRTRSRISARAGRECSPPRAS